METSTIEKLAQLELEAVKSGDYVELEKFYRTKEYRELTYVQRNKGKVTSHTLQLFLHCQWCYQQKYVNLIPDPTEEDMEKKEALIVGQAFDDLLTYPDEFDNQYEIVPRRSKNAIKTQLTPKMGETIFQCQREFFKNELFNHQPKKKILLYQFKNLLLKAEFDDIDEEKRIINDVKTCANITNFNPGYYTTQGAFYQVLAELCLGDKYQIRLEVTDKYGPFSRSQGWIYHDRTLAPVRYHILETLEKMAKAHELNWFTPTDDQDKLFNCPFYGYQGHGRPTKFLTY